MTYLALFLLLSQLGGKALVLFDLLREGDFDTPLTLLEFFDLGEGRLQTDSLLFVVGLVRRLDNAIRRRESQLHPRGTYLYSGGFPVLPN